MKVIDHIKSRKDTLYSIEILPAKKGENLNTLFKRIEPLLETKPSFIDVTSHREEYIYTDDGNGLFKKEKIRKRVGTVAISAAIINKYGIDTVPHLICGGFTKEETEYALIDLDFLGIENVMALRGDALKTEKEFMPTLNGNVYATDLIEQISNMNKGKYLIDVSEKPSATNFCIGVAGYPEVHEESPNMSWDIEILKKKINLGADYVVTQLFYDNKQYFKFVETCIEEGINVPIIPGIKPILTKKQLFTLPKVFNIQIPEELSKEILLCNNDEDVKKVGIEWCITQSKELKPHVPCLHYYTMSRNETIIDILKQVF